MLPFFVSAQISIPKKTNTIIISPTGENGLKDLAKEMIKSGYEIEKDFDLGYLNGTHTKNKKPFQIGTQLKLKAYEEKGKIYLSGDFSIFQKDNGDFVDFDSIAWKGSKIGAYKMAFKKMLALSEAVGSIEYKKR
jgi:hypothetical protein